MRDEPRPLSSQDLRLIDSYHYEAKSWVRVFLDLVSAPLRITFGGAVYHDDGRVVHYTVAARLLCGIASLIIPLTVLAVVALGIRLLWPDPHYAQLPKASEPERASYRADLLRGKKDSKED